MNSNKILKILVIATTMLALVSVGISLAQEAVTIVGTLNENGDLIDQNGIVYRIDLDVISDEDALRLHAVFEVNGIVEEDDSGSKWITIQRYKIVETE
jgi:hypothetical protein